MVPSSYVRYVSSGFSVLGILSARSMLLSKHPFRNGPEFNIYFCGFKLLVTAIFCDIMTKVFMYVWIWEGRSKDLSLPSDLVRTIH